MADYVRKHYSPDLNSEEIFNQYNRGDGHDGQIFLRHPEHHYIGGHVDGIGSIDGEHVVWEFKAPRMNGVNKIKRYGLNSRYYYQVQHYMMCAELERAVVGIWQYGLWRPLLIPVDANEKAQSRLIDLYTRLWEHIQNDTIPDFKVDLEEKPQEYDADKLNDLLFLYDELRNQKYEAKDGLEELKASILTMLRLTNKAVTRDFTVSIKRGIGASGYTRLIVSGR